MSNTTVENWDDKEFVLKKVGETNEFLLELASDRLKDDPEIATTAISKNGYNLKFVSKRLSDNEAIVLAAVNNNGNALCFASDRLRDDRDVILAATKHGYGLSLVSARLRDDKEIVLAVVKQNGNALEYASERLKDTEELVLAAVSNNGYALQYASERLRSDLSFCIECAKVSPESTNYVMGEAKKVLTDYCYDLVEIEQELLNKDLLVKLKQVKHIKPEQNLFKRNMHV